MILKKGFTQDDFAIQLEDWSDYLTTCPFVVGAYPKGNWNKRFRSWCNFASMEEAQCCFEELLAGTKTVFDFDFVVTVPGGNRIHIRDTKLERRV